MRKFQVTSPLGTAYRIDAGRARSIRNSPSVIVFDREDGGFETAPASMPDAPRCIVQPVRDFPGQA